MIKLKLISPTRGENYRLIDGLEKAFIRSAIRADRFILERKHTCFYGSKDFYVHTSNLCVSDSVWTESISFRIDGVVPIHTTAAGRLLYGFGCGCDRRHGGFFPSDEEPDNPKWEEYKKIELGKITFYITGQTTDHEVIPLIDIQDDLVATGMLRNIVSDYIAENVVSKALHVFPLPSAATPE